MKTKWLTMLLAPMLIAAEAPREGALKGVWSSGLKQFVGTAYEAYDSYNRYSSDSATAPISKVYFTGAYGVMTEVFWPTVDKAQVKDSQFVVVTKNKEVIEEKNIPSVVEWLELGVPAFKITKTDPQNRFVIEKLIYTSPTKNALIQRVRVQKISGLKLFYAHHPAASNTTAKDSAEAPAFANYLLAWQGDEYQSLVFSVPTLKRSVGFEGASDIYTDLKDAEMNFSYTTANDGNLILGALLQTDESIGEESFDLVLAFGSSKIEALGTAAESLLTVERDLEKYRSEWRAYQDSILDLSAESADSGKLFRASVAVLKSLEDKSFEGAFVASPGSPWGQFRREDDHLVAKPTNTDPALAAICNVPIFSDQVGGYHLVWPRDLYQMATTFMAIGDYPSATASLQYYRRTQYNANAGKWCFGQRIKSRNGSWAQNMWVDGRPYWNMLQMDQTAMPVILAYRLWKAEKIALADYWDMVKRASDFLVDMGPWTSQERWEEAYGASPSTIASEITALKVAAEMAAAMHDPFLAKTYQDVAESWNSKEGNNVEAWTFTQTGNLGNGKYYLRIDGASQSGDGSSYFDRFWDPDDGAWFRIANGGPWLPEKNVLDGGFLELVRFGIRSPLSYHVMETLSEYDSAIRVNTRKGPGFYRYSSDRYNYDERTNENTPGMLWPLLTGERGHYELARANAMGMAPQEAKNEAKIYLKTIEDFATPSLMIPEQVWDHSDHSRRRVEGEPTGAATPLGWAHGEYIKLLRSIRDNQIFDQVL